MTLDECFTRGQLRKTAPDIRKAKRALEIAAEKLGKARKLLKASFAEEAVVSAYASMFHLGRALLFRDGGRVKSDYCVVVYLREMYVKTGKLGAALITVMDSFREERHEVMYGMGGISVKEEEADAAIENAENMLRGVKMLIGGAMR